MSKYNLEQEIKESLRSYLDRNIKVEEFIAESSRDQEFLLDLFYIWCKINPEYADWLSSTGSIWFDREPWFICAQIDIFLNGF